jgi:hypothetical protein
MTFQITRRLLLGLIGAGPALLLSRELLAESALPTVTVSKDPDCGCCNGWVDHLRQAGFPVIVKNAKELQTIKKGLGVPDRLASCHTAEVKGYVIEGHVPADAIKRLLREAPEAVGLAVPGMPIGSPGMEGGTPEVYEVVMFRKDASSVFARYRATTAL